MDRLFQRLVEWFKDGMDVDTVLLLVLLLFIFQLKKIGPVNPKATIKSVTVY